MKTDDKLLQELSSTGISDSERTDLQKVARHLGKVPKVERSADFKSQQARRLYARLTLAENEQKKTVPNHLLRWFMPALATLLLMPAVIVGAAQQSMPGEPLYGIKRFSESVAVKFVPAWHDDIALRRSAEVKELVRPDKTNDLINQTLKAYKQSVDSSQKTTDSQPITEGRPSPELEQSITNLEQAWSSSTQNEQINIEQIIETTKEQLQLAPVLPESPAPAL